MFPTATRIYVATSPVDMRKSFDSLAALVRDNLQLDPLLGYLVLFYSRWRDKVKVFYWDRNGYCIFYKRLEKGTFKIPRIEEAEQGRVVIDDVDLRMILDGMDIGKVRRGRNIILR